MGNTISKGKDAASSKSPRGRKRRLSATENVGSSSKKRIRTTSRYIFKALFATGEGSDITVRAFNHEWKLHKIYLKQAGFFNKMFGGDWKDSDIEDFTLQIPDANITKEALGVTFGALYSDEIDVKADIVTSVLAAASLIQLEGLMLHCSEVMIESMRCENVCSYYEASIMYGQKDVQTAAFKWLETNLLIQSQKESFLKQIGPCLMQKIISSPDVFIVQVEMDLYTMLRRWIFVNVAEDEDKNCTEDINKLSSNYFKKISLQAHGAAFLDTEQGHTYLECFKALRLDNVLKDFGCCTEIESDKIIPEKWILTSCRKLWLKMLRVEQGIDTGPSAPRNTEDNSLEKEGLRCGRRILRDKDHCWRWNGYNFGIDLLVTYNALSPKSITIKRNIVSQHCVSSVGLVAIRKIQLNLWVFTLDTKGRVAHEYSSGNQYFSLGKDEETLVLEFSDEDDLTFPLYVSATIKSVSSSDIGNPKWNINELRSSDTLPQSSVKTEASISQPDEGTSSSDHQSQHDPS